MDDRMSDQTSTCRLGVRVTPRRPGFDFEGLEHELPRAWHPAGIGPTAFLEALSAMARPLLPLTAAGARGAGAGPCLRGGAPRAGMPAGLNGRFFRGGVRAAV